ncbi:MAG: GH116 family glycosyl hydrolase [Phycisphaeraceae bacterium]
MKVIAQFTHGPQRPQAAPVLPGFNLGRNAFFRQPCRRATEPLYEPCQGDSLAIHDGPRTLNHIIATGVWRLLVGDRPRIGMRLRTDRASYGLPAFVEGLGVGGLLSLKVTVRRRSLWLHEFAGIEAVLSPGGARWTCQDQRLGVTVTLEVQHSAPAWGYTAVAQVSAQYKSEVRLDWVFTEAPVDRVVGEHVEFRHGRFTRILLGLVDRRGRSVGRNGTLTQTLGVGPDRPESSRLLCVWGYDDYDRASVAEAMKRLDHRPFPSEAWLTQMKRRWFAHWIGQGLKPTATFRAALRDFAGTQRRAKRHWQGQRRRLWIKTPDAAFDTAVRHVAATMISQYEYPGFMHGTEMSKYGKINCGYYGYESAGLQDEVGQSLGFVSGTQDAKGRQRYFTPAFAISVWCEEHNFYFVEQVWHHYRWTGDKAFLRAMWPAVRRALEHALATSDPDGDGVMTAYYETWNCDTHARGGKSSVWTGLAASALRAAAAMARTLDVAGPDGFYDETTAPNRQVAPMSVAEHYQKLADRSAAAMDQFWQPGIGAFGSAEWNGDVRPRPAVMESNYILWRGAGDRLQRYMACRYIRDNFHMRTAPGVALEFINDAWPILWSHHYVANGDTCISALCAALAGDMDAFWPALKTVSNTLYNSDTATLTHGLLEDGRGCGMRQIVELEPQFIQATVDGVFGVQMDLGDNLITLAPTFPSDWPEAEIRLRQVRYRLTRQTSGLHMEVSTPVQRLVRVELPVRGRVTAVLLNGRPTSYELRSEVSACRVVVNCPLGRRWRIEVKTGLAVRVEGQPVLHPGQPARFTIHGGRVVKVLDPQSGLGRQRIEHRRGQATVEIAASRPGRLTIFLEVAAGRTRWLWPLDLHVKPAWEVSRQVTARRHTPAVISPAVDVTHRRLRIELANHSDHTIEDDAVITVAGHRTTQPVRIVAQASAVVDIPLEAVWGELSPGTNTVSVQLGGMEQTGAAVTWDRRLVSRASPYRQVPLDLSNVCTIALARLYHWRFQWRHDYTGGGVGVDWQDPPPARDARGWVLPTSPIAQLEYQSLPQGWISRARWQTPPMPTRFDSQCGIEFRTAGANDRDVVALACTEPFEQLPSEVRLQLNQPVCAAKLYLLTANLTKTVKCYYPGAEIAVEYDQSHSVVHTLVPPHNMPMMAQRICPSAFATPFGRLHGELVPLRMGGCHPNLSVIDIPLDPARPVTALVWRCVATETILGIVGATLLATAMPRQGGNRDEHG